MTLHFMSPKGPIMAADVLLLAERSGFKTGQHLTEDERARMRHMRLHERIEVPDIAVKFGVSTTTVYLTTQGFAPAKQKARPPSDAWAQQVLTALPELRKVARNLARLPDRVDDLVQETVLKALEKEAFFEARDGKPLMAWLATLMRNLHLTGFRRWREVEDVEGVFSAKFGTKPEQGHAFDLSCFWQAFDRLPAPQADALRLVVLQGLPYDEAAAQLGVKIGTIKSRVHRAREILARDLGLDDTAFSTDGLLAAAVMEL